MLLVVCSVFFSLCASFSCWRGVAQRWREKLELEAAAAECRVCALCWCGSEFKVMGLYNRFFKRFFTDTDYSPDCAVRFTGAAISASADRNLWRYILLKAFVPSYERMVQPSSKLSVAVNAVISTPPETATPYWPQGWK